MAAERDSGSQSTESKSSDEDAKEKKEEKNW